MKVLIIGNLGYVGPVLTEHLLKSHHEKYFLWGFDIGYFLSNHSVRNCQLPETYLQAQYFGDVRKFPESILDGMDAVVYLAAISNDPMGNLYEEPTLEINQHSAFHIASLAKTKGVKRFVFASSCSVYGSAGDAPRNEKSPVQPLTAYARSKVQAEEMLSQLSDSSFVVTCLRFATACGFSPRLRLDLVLNDFVASALVHKRIDILSDGTPWRPLIHVKDMSRAIEWALLRESTPPFIVINTGSDEWNYQIKDLAMAVKELIPGVEVAINPQGQPDKRSYKVDFSLFRKYAPEFQPLQTLHSTIDDLRQGLENLGFNNPNFRESEYIRLKTIQALIQKNVLDKSLYLVKPL